MRERLTSIGGYCYLWLMVGFFLGTLLLVGPVRVLTGALRARGWSEQSEDLVMLGVIGAYVVTSAFIAWWLFRREAQRLFTEHGVAHTSDTLHPRDVSRARVIAAKVRTAPKPAVVVVPFTAPRGPTDVADTFMEGFGNGATSSDDGARQ